MDPCMHTMEQIKIGQRIQQQQMKFTEMLIDEVSLWNEALNSE